MLPSPLVTIDQLKAHLTLLGAFKSLRTTVQTQSAEELILPPVVERMDVNKRWTWFVGLAVERSVVQRYFVMIHFPLIKGIFQDFNDGSRRLGM